MQINLWREVPFKPGLPWAKIILAMKLTAFIIFMCCMQISAKVHSQISISERNVPITSVLAKIQQQSGYNLFYENTNVKDVKINVKLANASLNEALDIVLKDQQLTYSIVNKTIVIKIKEPSFLDKLAVTLNSVQGLFRAIDIPGLVLDEKGLPLPGVTVRVKGTNKATSTDNSGKFYLGGVDDDAVLEFRMVGYKTLELSAKEKFETVQLEVSSKELEEVVVAYGKTTQQAFTGAITVIKGTQIESLPNRSLDRSLQGLVPGLQITNGNGQPGGGVSNMVLRGISTGSIGVGGSTVRNPLFVLDGIPVTQDHFQKIYSGIPTPVTNPMAQINPSDIESISVLKDAAAVALYGSKASNGVILITTKRGKTGKTNFSFKHQTDLSYNPQRSDKMLNQDEYLELVYETLRNTNPTLWTNDAIKKDLYSKFPYRIAGNDTTFYPAPNWGEELFNNPGATFSNNLSASGGGDKNTYYLNLEHSSQKGIVKKTGFDRTSFRMNLDNKPSNWLKLGANVFLSYNKQEVANSQEGFSDFGLGSVLSPLNPIKTDDGAYVFNYFWGGLSTTSTAMANPIAANEFNLNKNTAYRGLLNVSADIALLKHFTFTSTFGADFMLAESKIKLDPRLQINSTTTGSINDIDMRRASVINNNILRFDYLLARKHSFEMLIGQEAQINTQKTFNLMATGTGKPDPYYTDISSPGYSYSDHVANSSRNTLLSQFAQINYDFTKRYYFSASFRRDGSSLFGDNNKFGNYWSTGLGWVISSEKFMDGSKKWLNFLKLRGSIGASGNSSAVNSRDKYDLIAYALFLNQTAVLPGQLGNPTIKWEETFNWDSGLQAGLFDNKLNITVDLYNKKTDKLIYRTNLPSIVGYSSVNSNIGDINNRGIEISMEAQLLSSKNFSWRINANWSRNQNKLLKATGTLSSVLSPYVASEEGREFNSFYMAKWAGVNTDTGLAQWVDSLGGVTSDPKKIKKEFVGKAQPDGFGSFSNILKWKALELSVQFYYQYGGMFYNSTAASLTSDGIYPYANQTKSALDRWQKPGDDASNPVRKMTNTSIVSTRFLYKSDYIKLQNVMLTYKLPFSALQKLKLTSCAIFVQGNNLALWSTSSTDPDLVSAGGNIAVAYPNVRSFSIGLNVNF